MIEVFNTASKVIGFIERAFDKSEKNVVLKRFNGSNPSSILRTILLLIL